MHEVLVNRLGGLSLPRKSVVRLTDRSDMAVDVTVYVKQQHNNNIIPMTTFFSITEIVVYLPERTNTGLQKVS